MALSRRIGRSRFTLVLLVLTSLTLLTLDFRGFGPHRLGPQLRCCRPSRRSVDGAPGRVPAGRATCGAGPSRYDDLKKQNEALQDQVDQLRRPDHGRRGGRAVEPAAAGAGQPARSWATCRRCGPACCRGRWPTSTTPSRSARAPRRHQAGHAGGGRAPGWSARWCRCATRQAVVKLITDTSFPVGVTVLGTDVGGAPGIDGVATGQGNDQPAQGHRRRRRPGEPGRHPDHPGEPGSLFPSGLPVGTVAGVERRRRPLQQTLDVDLLADVHDLSYVSVRHVAEPQLVSGDSADEGRWPGWRWCC